MLQGKRFLTVLTAVTVCVTFAAGFTTQAAAQMPRAVTIDTSDKFIEETVLSSSAKNILKDQITETKEAVVEAKAGYDKEQKWKAEELKKREEEQKKEEEAKQAARDVQKAQEEAGAAQKAQEEADAAQVKAPVQANALGGQAASGDIELLASIIFCEAGNQPYEGQVAVGAVIMNRVRSGVYPNSISEVIYQSGQFGPAMTGWLDSVLASGGYTETAMQAAEDAAAGANPIGDCLYFGNGNYGIQIGDHFFH